MEFHPVANIFPLLQGEEYEKLRADIAESGLIQPIWVHPDGRIIDGRNRWRACVDTGTNARFETWDIERHGSLVAFVVSLNLHRRHLDSSQRAAIAVEVLPMLEEEARERQRQAALRRQERIRGLEQQIKQPDLSEGKKLAIAATVMQLKGEPKREKKRGSTEVYFIADGDLVKIGASVDPVSRFTTIKATNPNAKLMLTIPGGFELENELHRKYKHLRENNEWFRLDTDLMSEIEELSAFSKNCKTTQEFHSASEAADLFHTNRQYVSDAKRLKEDAPDLFEQVKNGDLTIPKAKQTLSQPMQVMLSHVGVEYYTPEWVISLARETMGQIDLDPASCDEAQKIVKAKTYYTAEQNGLSLPWFGKVWLNPPYSKTGGKSNQELWANRLISEYEAGNVIEGVLLVKSAAGYKWFEELWDKLPVCFLRERLSFTKDNGSDDGESKHGTAIFYLGKNLTGFIDAFSRYGRITTLDGRYISQRD